MGIGRKILAGAAGVLLAMTGATMLAPTAFAADQIWYQAIGRADVDAPCPALSDEDAQVGWSPWTPSWAQWVGDGAGGATCERQVTWAYSSPPPTSSGPSYPSAWCEYSGLSDYYLQFDGGWGVWENSNAYSGYQDPDCATATVLFAGAYVYAPEPYDPAALCEELYGSGPTSQYTSVVWRCD